MMPFNKSYASARYAFVSGLDCDRIGYQEIEMKDVIDESEKKKRITRRSPQLVLFQCILKKNSMEFIIQKSTEIGVDMIVPVVSGRVIPDSRKVSEKINRWQKISDSASKQSKRDYKCKVLSPENIYSIVVSRFDLFYVPSEKSTCDDGNLLETLKGSLNASSIGFIIGPEGGFEDSEVSFLKKNGFISVSLGDTTLRAETAAIIAGGIIIQLSLIHI